MVNVNKPTYGLEPSLIGNLCNYALMGTLCTQVYFYYITFPKDKLILKALVFTVLCADIAQTAVSTHFLWSIVQWTLDNPTDQAIRPHLWSLNAIPPLTGLVDCIVQCFFAWRISVLGGPPKVLIPILTVIITTSITSYILSIIVGIKGITEYFFFGLLPTPLLLRWSSICSLFWLVSSLVCDVLITLTLVIQLLSKRNKYFRHSNHILHRAGRLALETGSLTSALTITEFSLYRGDRERALYYLALLIISGKLYSNSLLASLNSRAPVFNSRGSLEEELSQLRLCVGDFGVDRSTNMLGTSTVGSHLKVRSFVGQHPGGHITNAGEAAVDVDTPKRIRPRSWPQFMPVTLSISTNKQADLVRAVDQGSVC